MPQADNRGVKTNTVFKNIAKKESMNLREFLRKKKVTIKVCSVSVCAVESLSFTCMVLFFFFFFTGMIGGW